MILRQTQFDACKKARSIWTKKGRSSNAIKLLSQKSGYGIFSARDTTRFVGLENMLKMKSPVTKTLEELKWDSLLENKWNQLKEIHHFRTICKLLQ